MSASPKSFVEQIKVDHWNIIEQQLSKNLEKPETPSQRSEHHVGPSTGVITIKENTDGITNCKKFKDLQGITFWTSKIIKK